MRAQRVGLVGPVGCGKTALIESLSRLLSERGLAVGVVTNDVYTRVDEEILRATGVLPSERIVGVATGGCPHSAIRDDPSLNEEAIGELERDQALDVVFVESGGDNLTAVFSPDLVDTWVFVLDVAGGHKVAGKGGPGIALAPVLAINKSDIADEVDTDLDIMLSLATEARGDGPVVTTSTKTGAGVEQLADAISLALRGEDTSGWKSLPQSHGHHHHHDHDHDHGRAAT
jgi:urease accessory protein